MSEVWIILLTAGITLVLFGSVLMLVVRYIREKHDGYLNVSATNPSQIYQLEINTEPEELRKQDYIKLKVRKVSDL